MNNISGNFDTYDAEIRAVRHFLKKHGVDVEKCNIKKYGGYDEKDTDVMSSNDVTVKLSDNRVLYFEVKQESYKRFGKYGELGVDFISVFHFKKNSNGRRGLYNKEDYDSFIKTVDTEEKGFKWGKLSYSKADIWLFYCENNGEYVFCEGYDYQKMLADNIFMKIKGKYPFAVNNKDISQMSYTDTWESATFFCETKCFWRI